MKTKRKKTFDCVEFQHQVGERIQRETAGMTTEEVLAYWKRQTDELRRYQERLRRERAAHAPR